MSKAFEIKLDMAVLADIIANVAQAIGQETQKCLAYSQAAYSQFLGARHATSAFYPLSLSSMLSASSKSKTSKQHPASVPSNIEVAKYIEQKAVQLGYNSQGIKLLPAPTGGQEIFEFTIEKPREREKVLRGGS